MNKKIVFTAVLNLFFLSFLYGQSADEILTKYFNAIGISKLAAVNTISISGSITGKTLKNNTIEYLVKKVRPYKQYMELTNKGEISKKHFDGRSEWAVTKGRTVKNLFDVEEQRKRKICFEGDLFYCKNNGYEIVYKGINQIEGLDFHQLNVTSKDGYNADYYIETGSFMLMKTVEGGVETFYSNFKTVEGVVFPFSTKVVSKLTNEETELNLNLIEFNKEVDNNLFVR